MGILELDRATAKGGTLLEERNEEEGTGGSPRRGRHTHDAAPGETSTGRRRSKNSSRNFKKPRKLPGRQTQRHRH